MKRHGMGLKSVIAVAAVVTVVYLMSIVFVQPIALVVGLYVSSVAAMVWMAIRILRDPYSTDKTFDQYFYQDRDDLRLQPFPELNEVTNPRARDGKTGEMVEAPSQDI
jgi:hypothetical protein